MVFTHDTEVALAFAAALVNTDVNADSDVDGLPDVAALDALMGEWTWTGSRTHDDRELEQVRELRPRLRAMWESDKDEVVLIANDLLTEFHALPSWSSTTSGITTCMPHPVTRRWPPGWQSKPRWPSSTWFAPTNSTDSGSAGTSTAAMSWSTSRATDPSGTAT